ncbi:MAG: tubulin binding cofactor C-domain-containing protein [Benjaminiella poitrasii]|nr:MAG: tubulin binding cofactor C-domain-containing protein [Benjaminiella poitrasii]
MTEKTATEASNDFWLKFKSERQAIEQQIFQSQSLAKADLASHFNTILKCINDLEKKLTKATDFIPSYDQRQFSMQLKELNESLEKIKIELTPKAKFSFKSRRKKTEAPVAIVSVEQVKSLGKNETKDDELLSDATVLFKDRENTVLTLAKSQIDKNKSIEILLSNLKYCVIFLDSAVNENTVQISAIHIKNVDHCVIYGGLIKGSVLVYGLNYSTLLIGCHQLRIHEAHHVDMMLHVTSKPIIEDSDNIQVGCWNATESINQFDQIEDFDWLKKQASPNWKILNEERQKMLEKEGLDEFKNILNKDNISLKMLNLLPAQNK